MTLITKGAADMQNNISDNCCPPTGICKVEALISIDERGQMVLPKDLRERANISAGDKLAVTSWEKNGEVCCMILTRANDLTDIVMATLGPMKDIL